MYNILIYPICLYFYLSINLNTKYIINLIYLYLGYTILMRAAIDGNTDVMKILLGNGADITAKEYVG